MTNKKKKKIQNIKNILKKLDIDFNDRVRPATRYKRFRLMECYAVNGLVVFLSVCCHLLNTILVVKIP